MAIHNHNRQFGAWRCCPRCGGSGRISGFPVSSGNLTETRAQPPDQAEQHISHIPIQEETAIQPIEPHKEDAAQCVGPEEGLFGRGLYCYRKWWERSVVDIAVGGHILTGTPIFTDGNTLRVVNESYSYLIPLEKVDFIRTPDGLHGKGMP